MFPVRLIFLAMGISMTISTATLGGESPNDRISTILAVMTSISESVDKLVGKVGNMETKLNDIDHTEQLNAEKVSKIEDRVEELGQEGADMKKRMDSMDTKMTSVRNRVNSMDTKMDKVDQDVKMNQIIQSNGWKYLGRGYMRGGIVEESYQGSRTLGQCFQICEDKHSADYQWNGFIWDPSNGYCYCEKKDQGHDPTRGQEYMHFLKQ